MATAHPLLDMSRLKVSLGERDIDPLTLMLNGASQVCVSYFGSPV